MVPWWSLYEPYNFMNHRLEHVQNLRSAKSPSMDHEHPSAAHPTNPTNRIQLWIMAQYEGFWVIGVPLAIIHFRMGFSLINHPATGVPPWLWKHPYRNHGFYSWALVSMDLQATLRCAAYRHSSKAKSWALWSDSPAPIRMASGQINLDKQ